MDERCKIFSLWTDETNRGMLSFIKDDLVDWGGWYHALVSETRYKCARCKRELKIESEADYVMFSLLQIVINPILYFQEGEVIVCGMCFRLNTAPKKYVYTISGDGVDYPGNMYKSLNKIKIHPKFNKYTRDSFILEHPRFDIRLDQDIPMLYNPKYNYYMFISAVGKDIELRASNIRKYDPYYNITHSLFEITISSFL